MKKSTFSKITTPILHKFQPLHGVTTCLPTFAVPQKGWSNNSFITPESCIALVYSEQYEKSIWKRDGIENHAILNAKNTLGLMGSRPKVARNFGLGPFLKLSFRQPKLDIFLTEINLSCKGTSSDCWLIFRWNIGNCSHLPRDEIWNKLNVLEVLRASQNHFASRSINVSKCIRREKFWNW